MNGLFFLGVDGGATNCRARLVDAGGRVLGEGRAGSANPRLGLAQAFASIVDAAAAACESAGLSVDILARTHAGLGLAGVGQKRDRDEVLAYPHPFAEIVVETDAHAACLGAHGGEDGGILVVGTGSCGVVMRDGRSTQVGGWGFPVSDHGSGAWIGLESVRRALLAHDGVLPTTPFSRAVMARFDHQPETVVAWMSGANSRDYAALAPLALEHAGGSDPMAEGIVHEAATDVVRLIDALTRLGAERLCLMGGLAVPLRPWLPAEVTSRLVEPLGDAADGALLMARRSTASAPI